MTTWPAATTIGAAAYCRGHWQIGRGEPAVQLVMDALDFHLLAAGRLHVGDAVPRVAVDGDDDLARCALERTLVPY